MTTDLYSLPLVLIVAGIALEVCGWVGLGCLLRHAWRRGWLPHRRRAGARPTG